jgi:deuterolysin
VKTSNLTENAFTHISAGQTLEITVDVASVHDLSVGGTFKVSSHGALPFAPHGSTTLSDEALAYHSNELEVNVDGATAAKVKRAIQPLDKRTKLQSECTGTKGTSTRQALQDCQQLASVAAGQASSGSATKSV